MAAIRIAKLFSCADRAAARGLAGAVFALLVVINPAAGVPINYGSFAGTSVNYIDVTENSTTDSLPLYGTPTLSGDSVSFSPARFSSSAAGAASDQTVGNLTFTVEAQAGKRIGTISFSR